MDYKSGYVKHSDKSIWKKKRLTMRKWAKEICNSFIKK